MKAICLVRRWGNGPQTRMENEAVMLADAARLSGVDVVSVYSSSSLDALSDVDVDAILAMMAEAGSNRIVIRNLVEIADPDAGERFDAIMGRLPRDTLFCLMEL